MSKLPEKRERGISIYFVFLLLVILFSLSLGLSNLIFIRFQIAKKIGKSVVAFYAADSGIEKVLYDVRRSKERMEWESPPPLPPSPPGCRGKACVKPRNSGSLSDLLGKGPCEYGAGVTCREGYGKCSDFCDSCVASQECDGPRFCVFSRGAFKGTKRAIEVKY